jgi:hypothetical protein
MTENFPHLMKDKNMQIQQAHWTPRRTKPKRSTLTHIITRLSKAKDKKRILKAARVSDFDYKQIS